jgi:transcriptional regulator with XRE-family HTH domain
MGRDIFLFDMHGARRHGDGMKLEAYRKAHRYNASQFAALIDVHPSTITRLERGEIVSPSRKLIMDIMRVTEGQVMPNDHFPSLEDDVVAAEAGFTP